MERKAAAPNDTRDWAVIFAYVFLIALFAGAQTVPAFRTIVSAVFFRINDIVRALIGA